MTILETGIWTAIASAISLTAFLVVCATYADKPRTDRAGRVAARVTLVAFVVATALFCSLAVFYRSAAACGLWTPNIELTSAIESMRSGNTPQDESAGIVGADLTDTVVVFYRFGCPDCEATHADIVEWAQANGLRLRWVSTRSDEGRAVFGATTLTEVPSMLATSATGERLELVVYTTTDGEAHVSTDALGQIARFMGKV